MRPLLVLITLGSFAFIATMIDNLFAFAAQLAVTPRARFGVIAASQSAGVAALLGLAVAVGSTLDVLPIRAVGVLAVAPWALAVYAWRHRNDGVAISARRGAITTFLVTLGLGGDNLAVWIPLLRANNPVHQLLLGVVFATWQGLFIALAWALATHPRVVAWGRRSGAHLIPWLYVLLGLVILYECHIL